MDTNLTIEKRPNRSAWAVRIDRKVVGEIRLSARTRLYRYFPKGAPGGEEYATLAACERSLRV
jgi:hypothetical protein